MDKRIIDAAIAGDSAAFETIYKATFVQAHAIAVGIVKDDFEAYDIVQESYITLLQKLPALQDPNAMEGWFSRIVRNTAIDFVRKNRPALFTDLESGNEDAPALVDTISTEYSRFDPEQMADRAEIRKIMEKIINTLPKKQRICVLLRWRDDMKISEIAQATGLSESTVKSCLRYGHDKIAQKVQELEKKGFKLRSLTPIMLIPALRWALGGKGIAMTAHAAAAGTAAGFAGGMAAGGAAASASAAAATAGTAAATGFASSVAVKLVAGITAAALVVGGGVYAGTQLFAPEELPEDRPSMSQDKEHSSHKNDPFRDEQEEQEDQQQDSAPTPENSIFFIKEASAPLHDGVIKYAGNNMFFTVGYDPNAEELPLLVSSDNEDILFISRYEIRKPNQAFVMLQFRQAGTANLTIAQEGGVSLTYEIIVKEEYDFKPDKEYLTPEEFAECVRKVLQANGVTLMTEVTKHHGSIYQDDSELTWQEAKMVGQSYASQALKQGYNSIYFTYKGLFPSGYGFTAYLPMQATLETQPLPNPS